MNRKPKTSVRLAATGLVSGVPGRLVGIFVQTSSSLTLKLWDNNAASGGVIIDTTATISAPAFYPIEVDFNTALFATFGGTGSVAFIIEPG